MWRVAANQPGGKRSRGSACSKNEQKPDSPPAVRPGNQHVTQAVRLRETQPEDRSDKSRKRASDEREQRERQ
jgi:hypothetical protein